MACNSSHRIHFMSADYCYRQLGITHYDVTFPNQDIRSCPLESSRLHCSSLPGGVGDKCVGSTTANESNRMWCRRERCAKVWRSRNFNNFVSEMLKILCLCFCDGSLTSYPFEFKQEINLALEFVGQEKKYNQLNLDFLCSSTL
jgi:hypothetical protein